MATIKTIKPGRLGRPQKAPRYVLARDLIIPAGTEVDFEPAGRRTTFGIPFASIIIGMSRDSTAEFTMPMDEAVALGVVVECTPKAA